MNKLNIELTNCFGIDSLKHEFDFGKFNQRFTVPFMMNVVNLKGAIMNMFMVRI